MENYYTVAIFLVLLCAIALPYWLKATRKRREAEHLREKGRKAGILEPTTLHPKIDLLNCIGCGSCVKACPEDVLGIIEGRAAIVNGLHCVGHALCVDACPVGAITLGFGKPTQGMEIPFYDDHLETNVPGLYIAGELGGIGLIRNAVKQGVGAIGHIAAKPRASDGSFDVVIIGAGPAGIGAALAAQEAGLRYLVLEQYDLGGSILHYPRQKLVLTSPVDFPLYGRFKESEISKEDLLALFSTLAREFNLSIECQSKVERINHESQVFRVETNQSTYAARHIILAIGRRGSPRKLNVPGEDLSKVAYRLIEAEQYTNKRILVVGGGDSAIEAAVGLSRQKGNDVTLSYRRGEFVRLKEKNETNIRSMSGSGKVKVIFNSEVAEIRPDVVTLREQEKILRKVENDFVFVFAGGELPGELLKKIGVKLRTEEIVSKVA
ncbi:MAG TPA: NAD(P)-binding domain-containing protein [Bacteroidota bacterium]|nr:NAD(P)-binding domain-containing protein [Bacteroidota bacterium]